MAKVIRLLIIGVFMASYRYVESVLLKGERVEYATSLHWIAFTNGLFMMVLGAVISQAAPHFAKLIGQISFIPGFTLPQLLAWVGMFILFLGFMALLSAYAAHRSTEIVVTNRRFVVKVGLISRATQEIFLNRVEAASIDQGILGRLLDFGTISVRGTGGGITPIHRVEAPRRLQEYLMREIEEREDEQRDRGQNSRQRDNNGN